MKFFNQLKYQERKQLFRKGLYLGFTLLILSFIAGALFGDSGILVNMRVKTEYQALLKEQARLKDENARLSAEIRALKLNERKIEALGRKTFGFGKPGEVIFYFPPNADASIERYQSDVSE